MPNVSTSQVDGRIEAAEAPAIGVQLGTFEDTDWMKLLDERQRAEVRFCLVYAEMFNHGTDGHNLRVIVANLARILDEYEMELNMLGQENAKNA